MTSIQHLSDRVDGELTAMQGSIWVLRGDLAQAITSVREDFQRLADQMGLQNATGIHNLNETILQAQTRFGEQQQALNVHQQTLGGQEFSLQHASNQFGNSRAELETTRRDLQQVHGMVSPPALRTLQPQAQPL